MKQLNDLIADFWRDYAALLLLGAGLIGVIALIALGVWAKRSRKPLRPIALAVSMNLALLLNAEGMWVIAIDQLQLPEVFAVLVFAVFEICFLTATSLAAEQYRRTTVYGPDGKIVTPGHPGPMLYIAALIAAISGIIVASNAVTGTEKLLRLAVPCVIFLMWWAALTAAGQRVRRGRFAYSPRRLAERWGWLIPDDDPDLVRMAADRQVRRMIVNHHRVSSGRWPKSWWRSRLLKDARTAGEPVVADVIGQLARIQRVMDLLIPGGAPVTVAIGTPAAGESGVAAPAAEPAPGVLAAPGVQSASGALAAPGSQHAPDPLAAPDAQPAPEVLAAPDAQPAPEVLAAPDAQPAPGVLAAPGVQPASAGVASAGGAQPSLGVPDLVAGGAAQAADDQRVSSGQAVPAALAPSSSVPAAQGAAVPAALAPSSSVPAARGADPGVAPSAALLQPAADPSYAPVQPVQFVQPRDIASVDAPEQPGATSSDVPGSGAVNGRLNGGAEPVEATLEVPAPRRSREDAASTAPVSPAPAVPTWASTPTGARPAVSIVGSPWWRLAVQNLSRHLASEASPEELIEMSYLQVTELARTLAPRVPELGEGVVRAFVIDYVRELSGEHGEAAYPWRDLLPAPAVAPKGSPAWLAGLEALRSALEEELGQGESYDPQDLAGLLAPSAPRLDDVTVRGFVADYLLALGGQTGPGSAEEWQHLLPRPQSGRGATDEEVLEAYGEQLEEYLRATGRLSRYRVQALTGVKSRIQADRIKATVEERAAAPAGR